MTYETRTDERREADAACYRAKDAEKLASKMDDLVDDAFRLELDAYDDLREVAANIASEAADMRTEADHLCDVADDAEAELSARGDAKEDA